MLKTRWAPKCWDQIANGYSIPNMGKNAKVDQSTLDDSDYEGASGKST
jgi:hypothetical protein